MVFDSGEPLSALMTLSAIIAALVPVMRLHQFANAIDQMNRGADFAHLHDVLRSMQQFWKSLGVVVILMLISGSIVLVFLPFL